MFEEIERQRDRQKISTTKKRMKNTNQSAKFFNL
jgi:hypothetical protein